MLFALPFSQKTKTDIIAANILQTVEIVHFFNIQYSQIIKWARAFYSKWGYFSVNCLIFCVGAATCILPAIIPKCLPDLHNSFKPDKS